jgi:hypothetical protein
MNRPGGCGRTPCVIDTEQTPAAAAGPTRRDRWVRRVLGALAGLIAAAVALGVAELVAGLVGRAASPVVAVGNAAITLVPEPLKEYAIRTFGARDKLALVSGVLVVVAIYAIAVGLVALRRPRVGALGVALFGVVGIVAAVTRPAAGALDWLPSLLGALVGVPALLLLIAPLTVPRRGAPAGDAVAPSGSLADRLRATLASGDRKGTELDRRSFFVTSGVAVGVAALAGGGGRLLQRRFDVADARAGLTLPRPASAAPPLPAGADLAKTVRGVTPLVTANRDF